MILAGQCPGPALWTVELHKIGQKIYFGSDSLETLFYGFRNFNGL